ncbi:MAG: glycosyltransferase [Prevotella sp.]|nr:glycosyltransferase [Prevotella sp.]
MNILFLIFHGFDPNNGISKKISYQLEAFKANGHEAHLCYMDENGSKRRIADETVIADYGNGKRGKILKRTEFGSIVNYAIKNQIEFVYIRSNHNANPFTIHMVRRMKKAGMKVVMEIPTYPYDQEYFNKSMRRQLIQDKLFRNLFAKQLDAIVTFSEEDIIFGQQTIRISNGIDFGSVRMKKECHHPSNELHLIGVAEIHRWHGFDRVIKGLADYYATPKEMKVYFHVVGYFFSPVEEAEITEIIKTNHLEPYVILYGKKHGEELDEIFDQCDFGIGSLGRHRVGIDHIKTLKNREYAARGIPFVYSETDTDFDQRPYVLKVPADETTVRIEDIIGFYQQLTITPQEIRDSIANLSWKHQMGKVINTVNLTQEKRQQTHIAYCIPSLDHSGGMERVLTTKADYLVEQLGYNVSIIITDDKGTTPYFPLSDKIQVIQLDVNIDNLWQHPIWKRLYLYQKRMAIYRQRLERCLNLLKPDITISLLRREINFLTHIHDGSAKVGEIHFGRYKYREANFGFLPGFANQWITNRWMAQLDRKVKQLDRFVVLTHEDSAYWKGLSNQIVIPNPITIEQGITSECTSKQVIAVGRYTYQKGFDLLISTWGIVHLKHPDWALNIYGGGNREAYQQQVDKLGLQKAITCNGPVNHIAEKYRESSIFVLSSRFEGLPLVLMEAMSSGLAPVAFTCPCGPRDIITNGEDGLLCENGNIEKLAEGICRLIEDETLRKEMGKKASVSIQRFTVDRIMQQWDQLFKEIVRENRADNT